MLASSAVQCSLVCLFIVAMSRISSSSLISTSDTSTKAAAAAAAKTYKDYHPHNKYVINATWDALVVYHLGDVQEMDEDRNITANNVQLFVSTIIDNENENPISDQLVVSVFYMIIVVNGEDNAFYRYLPKTSTNVEIISWSHAAHSPMDTHTYIVYNLHKNDLISKFKIFIFLDHFARGPLIKRSSNEWVSVFLDVFASHPTVGLIGPSISCHHSPYIPGHMFAMNILSVTAVFIEIMYRYKDRRRSDRLLALLTKELHFDLYSLSYDYILQSPDYKGNCLFSPSNRLSPHANHTGWCHSSPKHQVFLYWRQNYHGGGRISMRDLYCDDTVQAVTALTADLLKADNRVVPLMEEEEEEGSALHPSIHSLYQSYDLEMDKDHFSRELLEGPRIQETPKVCLLVRTTKRSPIKVVDNITFFETTIDDLILSLLRQTNAQWEAYFFLTDEAPFEEELLLVLGGYKDHRLTYLPIGMEHRPKYTKKGSGYNSTDEALRAVRGKSQCEWLSVTNCDNVYGSDVIARVFRSSHEYSLKAAGTMMRHGGSARKPLDMIIVPVDSRSFKGKFSDPKDYPTIKKLNVPGFDGHCRLLDSNLQHTSLGYTIQPLPTIKHMDLASIFLRKEKFFRENVNFGSFTNTLVSYQKAGKQKVLFQRLCDGCQDGFLMHELVVFRHWSFLKIDLLQRLDSIVFHGPSPLLCVASRNVWYDHPLYSGCMHTEMVSELYTRERSSSPGQGVHDWEYYRQQRTCLRLTEGGYANVTAGMDFGLGRWD